MKLTNDQQDVVSASAEDRLLVLAGPGTGKTEVVARRLAFLLGEAKLKASQILVLSFSRAAVKALVSRIRSVGDTDSGVIEDLRYLTVRTFDSWTFRVLRFLGEEPAKLLRRGYDTNINHLAELIDVEGLQQLEQRSAARLTTYRHVIVDEAQDLTGPRADLVRTFLQALVPAESKGGCGFTILGDGDQSIYDWTSRGDENGHLSSRELLDWLQHEYGDTLCRVPLKENHRASSTLAKLCREASALLSNNGRDVRPDFEDLLAEGAGHCSLEEISDLLRNDGEGTFAVLCRDNSQVLELAIALRDAVDPEQFARLSLLTGSPPCVLPSWVSVLLHPARSNTITRSQFTKIVNAQTDDVRAQLPGLGDPEELWSMLLRFARVSEGENSVSLDRLRERIWWPDSLPDDEGEPEVPLVLSTIHQSKGLEFDQVCLLPKEYESSDDDEFQVDPGEEARITYVGMTRAREGLALLETETESRPFRQRTYAQGSRTRWHRWSKTRKGGSFNHLEVGIDGDVDGESFVSSEVHGDSDEVLRVQRLLLERGAGLIGREVVLSRFKLPGEELRFVYDVTLKDVEGAGLLIARTSRQLTLDILSTIPKKQTLPKNVYSLRVGSVTSFAATDPPSQAVPAPWKTSGLWLGVTIHGIAQFMSYWKSSKGR